MVKENALVPGHLSGQVTGTPGGDVESRVLRSVVELEICH
jgi:hypothetical protein